MAEIDALRPPRTLDFAIGAAAAKDEILKPNFEDATLNRGQTVEGEGTLRLQLNYERFQLKISTDYSRHLAGEENPYYPAGLRPYEVSAGGQNLVGRRLDLKVGRFPVVAGRTFGLIDGAGAEVHSPSRRLSLEAFGGFVPEPVTMERGERTAWGTIARAEVKKNWLDLNYHEVLSAEKNIERRRIGCLLANQNINRLEVRASGEYDPLNEQLIKLALDSDYQVNGRWTAGAGAMRKDPSFEPGSFFNTFPHFPYYRYSARGSYYPKRKTGLDFSAGNTRFEYDAVYDGGADVKLYGFSAGASFSRGSGDPYLDYQEFHAAYSRTVRDRLAFGAAASQYIYNDAQFKDNYAYSAGSWARWEFKPDLVANAAVTLRRNVDGVSDPLFSAGITYYYARVFGGGK